MKEFISIFDINDITTSTWKSMTNRLVEPISMKENSGENNQHKYRRSEKVIKEKVKYYQEIATKENKFEGLLNYLKTNCNINNEIEITASSYGDRTNYGTDTLLQYDNENSFFYSNNERNSWICIEFKTHHILPSSYVIRTCHDNENSCHLKTWVFEGSKDNKEWIQLDEQINNNALNGPRYVHTFDITNYQQQPFKYLRIRQTGRN